jgi:creatinine amidohydrolase
VKEHPYEVAVLPLGATEPHNLHLPYGTDTFESEEISGRACEAAHQRGARVVMLPAVPYGTETNQMRFPLAMNLNPSTLFAVVRDLVNSLEQHGIHKLLILNSHGGNEINDVAGITHEQRTSISLDWFDRSRPGRRGRSSTTRATMQRWNCAWLAYSHLVAIDPRPEDCGREAWFVHALKRSIKLVSITRPWHLRRPGGGQPTGDGGKAGG